MLLNMLQLHFQCLHLSTFPGLVFTTAGFQLTGAGFYSRARGFAVSTCESVLGVCSLLDCQHPGLIEVLVPEKDRGNGSDVTVGSHHY